MSAQDSRSRTAPAIDLVAEPLLETAGVRTFDFFRRETVDLVTVTGGQFDLPSQRTHTQRLTAELRRSSSVDLIVTAEFLALRNINVLSVLPPASDIVLRLFPERFTRDPSGRLTRIDLRPVIFPGQKEEELRTAVNLVAPFPAGSSSGRLQVNGSLRLLLSSKLQLTPAIGSVDLLDRGAIGLGGAMRPRINLDFTFGYSDRGLGVRLGGEHRSQSFLGGTGEAGALTFAPLTLLSLRAFAEGSRLQALSPLLRNTRISLAVQNLANRREQVSDEVGVVPLAYQAALRDPVGRSIEIELRRTF